MKRIPLFLGPIPILQYSYSMSSKMNFRPAISFLCEHGLLPVESITPHQWHPDSNTNQGPIQFPTYSDTEVDTPTPTASPIVLPVVQVKSSVCTELTDSIRSKIRALRMIAFWPFRKIGSKLNIPLTTVYTICQQPSTPCQNRFGRPRLLTTSIQNKLIHHASLLQENLRKSLGQIAEESGILVNKRTLGQALLIMGTTVGLPVLSLTWILMQRWSDISGLSWFKPGLLLTFGKSYGLMSVLSISVDL